MQGDGLSVTGHYHPKPKQTKGTNRHQQLGRRGKGKAAEKGERVAEEGR